MGYIFRQNSLSRSCFNPYSAKKKMHLEMSSTEVVCCKQLPSITDELSIEANSVDPEQTAPIGSGLTRFATEAS